MESIRPEVIFQGFAWSLDYRPAEPSWPAPYRCRVLPSKVERQCFRVEVFGSSAAEAMDTAARAVRIQNGPG